MNLSKSKIVLIGTTSSMMFQFRQDLIAFLIQKGWEVYTFICEYNAEELERLKEIGATPVTYNMSRGGLNPLADLKAIKGLIKKIKEIQPDIVFSFYAKPIVYGTLAARTAKVPKVIGMLEGLGYTFTDQPNGISLKAKIVRYIQVLLYKLALPKLDDLIFLNHDDPKDLLENYSINTKKIHILGGIGLNLEQYPYSTAPTNPIHFLFIGRLLKEKGIFELAEAAKIVKEQYPECIVTILGAIDPENMGALKQEELDKLIEEKVFNYPGYVNNVQEWIKSCSVFILPSYREGIPRSTQEAMAIGRPAITTDVPGCRETVIDGINGFLIPKWNSEILAEKMIYFIKNPDQVSIMGEESYKIAMEKFNVDAVNIKLANIMDIIE